MGYNIGILRKENYKISNWSGGRTTELLIFPPEASYSERNFKWRLSSATVEAEQSTFTSLPGISRIIMVLEGELLLEHQGHHKIQLKSFQKDSFMGDWVTNSYGKVTDFNLMMAEGCMGKLEAIDIEAGKNLELCLENNEADCLTEVFYLAEGEIVVVNGEDIEEKLIEGDSICINAAPSENGILIKLCNDSKKEVKLVRSTIQYH
ncbi:HutD/Ves family protein [Candidatus Clostridium stratigraminis]|uniref:HutD family protein n=1 Tax=Candidatus Clostridium stratigraminis TaxID=3381661 RepID=A0ABW8T5I2_9CLOT